MKIYGCLALHDDKMQMRRTQVTIIIYVHTYIIWLPYTIVYYYKRMIPRECKFYSQLEKMIALNNTIKWIEFTRISVAVIYKCSMKTHLKLIRELKSQPHMVQWYGILAKVLSTIDSKSTISDLLVCVIMQHGYLIHITNNQVCLTPINRFLRYYSVGS